MIRTASCWLKTSFLWHKITCVVDAKPFKEKCELHDTLLHLNKYHYTLCLDCTHFILHEVSSCSVSLMIRDYFSAKTNNKEEMQGCRFVGTKRTKVTECFQVE